MGYLIPSPPPPQKEYLPCECCDGKGVVQAGHYLRLEAGRGPDRDCFLCAGTGQSKTRFRLVSSRVEVSSRGAPAVFPPGVDMYVACDARRIQWAELDSRMSRLEARQAFSALSELM